MTAIEELNKRIAALENELASAKETQTDVQRRLLAAEERANELNLDLIRTQQESKKRLAENEQLLEGYHSL